MTSHPLLNNEIRNKIMILVQQAKLDSKDGVNEEKIKQTIASELHISKSELPSFKLYKSSQIKTVGKKSGFDGVAIHFLDKEKKINEVYYLFKGTEPKDFNDVWADAAGIGAGVNTKQLEDAKKMYDAVQTDISKRATSSSIGRVKKFGDGYSLGGDNMIGLAITEGGFDDVRGLNDAPLNVYQLARFDRNFRSELLRKFHVEDPDDISEKDLLKFTKEFYGSEIPKISHTRVKGEPLHTQSFKGKLYIGHKITVLGDPNTPDFPDAGSYPLASISDYFLPLKLDELRYKLGVSGLLNSLKWADQHMGLSGVENAIINSKEAFKIITSTTDGKILIGSTGLVTGAGVLGMLLNSPGLAYQTGFIYGRRGQVGLHSLELLADLYSQEANNLNTVFVATDVISGDEIKLYPAMLYSFMAQCQLGLNDKEKVLNSLKQYLNVGIDDIQEEYQKEILQKISVIESHPGDFMVEVGKDKGFLSLIGEERIAESVQFDKQFDKVSAAATQPIEDLIGGIENEIKHLRSFLERYVANVEKMFEKDKELASLIKGMKSELRGA